MGAIQQKLKRRVYARAKGRCEYCKRKLTLSEATLDHLVPRSLHGGDGPNNLRLACAPCNAEKKNMRPWEWLLYVARRMGGHNEGGPNDAA